MSIDGMMCDMGLVCWVAGAGLVRWTKELDFNECIAAGR